MAQEGQRVGRPALGKRHVELGCLPSHSSSKIGLQKEQTLLVATLDNKTWKYASSRGFPGQGKKEIQGRKKRICLSLISSARRNLQASHFLACGLVLWLFFEFSVSFSIIQEMQSLDQEVHSCNDLYHHRLQIPTVFVCTLFYKPFLFSLINTALQILCG